MHQAWPWIILFLLGCYHGINPGMGWLFAVALGLQEKSTRAVLLALPPIALGHALSVAIIVAIFGIAELHVSHTALKVGAATLLFVFGAYRLVRFRHPKWVGMRVGFWGLTAWAFIMSTGHGAGLMLLPIISANPQIAGMPGMSASNIPSNASLLWVVAVHTFGYLLIMTSLALVVYKKFGLALLTKSWFNLDLMWAIALVVTGLIMLFV